MLWAGEAVRPVWCFYISFATCLGTVKYTEWNGTVERDVIGMSINVELVGHVLYNFAVEPELQVEFLDIA